MQENNTEVTESSSPDWNDYNEREIIEDGNWETGKVNDIDDADLYIDNDVQEMNNLNDDAELSIDEDVQEYSPELQINSQQLWEEEEEEEQEEEYQQQKYEEQRKEQQEEEHIREWPIPSESPPLQQEEQEKQQEQQNEIVEVYNNEPELTFNKWEGQNVNVNTWTTPTSFIQQELQRQSKVITFHNSLDENEQIQQLLNCFQITLPTNAFDHQLQKLLCRQESFRSMES